ncbi:E3 ubiquitin protein ligase DRIP2-like [Carica papaya]|uniref:E3 ubiquitin protein ligase DRIP2-like n=1 Tax=Carica papaya TaxID=3649 RepID=UPI000B8CC47A|nr:E3 ubiquitin protein ligase DRIP2-like [Carica papaya]
MTGGKSKLPMLDTRDKVVERMTCGICNNLFEDATTINECLHTFCKKCIHKRFLEEDQKECPVCGIELDSNPMKNLRPDHLLQALRQKLFLGERKRDKEPEKVEKLLSDAMKPYKRKQKPLSSVGNNKINESIQSAPTEERLKSVPATRKNHAHGKITKQTEESAKKVTFDPKILVCPHEKDIKSARTKSMQIQSNTEENMAKKSSEEGIASLLDLNINMWTPLNCLAEVARETLSKDDCTEVPASETHLVSLNAKAQGKKPSAEVPASETHLVSLNAKAQGKKPCTEVLASETHLVSVNVKAQGKKPIVNEKESTMISCSSMRTRRSQDFPSRKATEPKRAIVPNVQDSPPRTAIDSERRIIPTIQTMAITNSESSQRFKTIWFSLVASENQKSVSSLPQIPSPYLRVKDGNLPVSYIKKYLVKKLGLVSEDEVEIFLKGHPMISSVQLHQLVKWWIETSTTSTIQTSVGSSAKDFVMVLSYSRKVYPLV